MLRHLSLSAVILIAMASGACPLSHAALTDEFEAKEFTGTDNETLRYRWLTPPESSDNSPLPLVIFLHGAGERGDDNEAQLKHCVRRFAEPAMRQQFPCYVLAPQCPRDKRWVEVDWGNETPHATPEKPSVPMGLLLELIPSLMKKNRIDPSRVYLAGLSMGGFGVWDMMVRCPDLVAAAVPICGGADNSQAKTIAHIPVWVWHGANDTAVKTVRSQSVVLALKEAGGKPIYTELPGVGHGAWGPAFAHEPLFPWLFSQRKPDTRSR